MTWCSGLVFYGRIPATTAPEDGWYRFVVRAKSLKQPENSGLHDDHLHVRLYCPESDRAFGCLDAWQPPWHRTLPVHTWAFVLLGNHILRAVDALARFVG